MRTCTLPNGDTVAALGLGTWRSPRGKVGQAVREAIGIGYRHVDCAAIYGNEPEIGEALAEAFGSTAVTRDEIWITSKLWNDAHEEDRVEAALKKTLSDLRIDQLDLYLVHWPVALRPGVMVPETPEDFLSLDEVPLAATWRGMEACQRAGLCRHIGVSNFSERTLREILEVATVRPVMNQVELHPLLQQTSLLESCRREGVLVTAYSPLGSPDRPPTMKQADEPSLLKHPAIVEIARGRGLTSAQVLIAWAVSRGTIAIPKSVNLDRLRENLESADVELNPSEMEAIARLDRGRRFVDGVFWEMEGAPYTAAGIWGDGSS